MRTKEEIEKDILEYVNSYDYSNLKKYFAHKSNQRLLHICYLNVRDIIIDETCEKLSDEEFDIIVNSYKDWYSEFALYHSDLISRAVFEKLRNS